MTDERDGAKTLVRSLLDEELMFASVAERDVDFLLIEEFRSSVAFQEWFRRRSFPEPALSNPDHFRLTKVFHSLSSSAGGLGEMDIVVAYEWDTPAKRAAILIEDKIDASFQDRQAERYQDRKKALLSAKAYDAVACVLVAPREFLEGAAESRVFDRCVAYEDIVAHLRARIPTTSAELDERLRHRCEVLGYAIEQYRRGWRPIPDEHVSGFWMAHYKRAQAIAPDLEMKAPKQRPAQSRWVYFNESLPRDPRLPIRDLYHKMDDAQVHFVVHTWARHFESLEPLLRPTLDADMWLTTAGRAVAVVMDVKPAVDLAKPADAQCDAIDAALRDASRLRAWYVRNRPILHECARVATKHSNASGRGQAP